MYKILIIDQNNDFDRLKEILEEQEEYEIVSFREFTEVGVYLKDSQIPDLILLSNFKILDLLRNKYTCAKLPIVMLTSDDNVQMILALRKMANDYLTKPIDTDLALAKIRHHLHMFYVRKNNLLKKEIETIGSIVVTYNHEIINPLTIIKMCIDHGLNKITENDLDKIQRSIDRIETIILKIQTIQIGKVKIEEYYTGHRVMIKI